MAGGFSPIDEVRCEHYAAFASHLGRREFDWIYWSLFVFVILMLFLSSWQYSGYVTFLFPSLCHCSQFSLLSPSYPPNFPYTQLLTRTHSLCPTWNLVILKKFKTSSQAPMNTGGG